MSFIKKIVDAFGRNINKILVKLGYRILPITPEVLVVRKSSFTLKTMESTYEFNLKPMPNNPHTNQGVNWSIVNQESRQVISRDVWYASFALMTLLRCYEFSTVLDIGSARGVVGDILTTVGKQTTSVEIMDGYPAPDYRADYLEIKFDKKFDVIWCSHVLEHQRNIGVFLEKCLNDLNEGGVLVVTVPLEHTNIGLTMGHCNYFSLWSLCYQLASVGFDIKKSAVAAYYGNLTVIAKKPVERIQKISSFAPYPPFALSEEDAADFGLDHGMTPEEFKLLVRSAATDNLMNFLPSLDTKLNWMNWPLNPDGAIFNDKRGFMMGAQIV
jgi:SAM-dependent methyltransferase